MASDVADWTTAVNVTGGSVSISGTATVQITGTPTVAISGTPTVNIGTAPTITVTGSVSISGSPTVNIGNTPSVVISSGSVTAVISGTPNINIQSQSVTLQTSQPQQDIGNTINGTTSFGPPGFLTFHALGLQILNTTAAMTLSVKGNNSSVEYCPVWLRGPLSVVAGQRFVFPLTPLDPSDTGLSVTCNSTQKLQGILDTAAVEVFTLSGQSLAQVPAPYDVQGLNHPAVASVASVVLAATPGKAYRCHLLRGGLLATTAAAHTVILQLADGASNIYLEGMAVQAAIGSSDHGGFTGGAFKGTAGNSMTASFSANGAGGDETVNIGAYLA